MNNTTDQRLREIAERENKATKGPWLWNLNLKSKHVELEGMTGMRETVLRPARWGMSSAKLQFLVNGLMVDCGDLSKAKPEREHHKHWCCDIDHPDALFIAHSRQDVPWLLSLIKKQREALEADALADKLFERAEAHREESIACGYDNDPTGSLAVTESYKAANAQALIATQLKRDALNFSLENL